MERKIDYRKFGFLPYQIAWLEDTSQIKLYEKSRRIGLTYAQAFEDVLDAAIFGKFNVWFSSNNTTNAREYIDYCKKYASALNAVIKSETQRTLLDEADANTFVITFSNGKKITALSSSPNQLHGKGGKIVLDEFARRDNELEVWEAASPAALVWGYPIRIISTHRGKQSVFYSFVKRLERGELTWSHHRTTFVEAVRQGLADKALKKKCTPEEQDAYIEKIKKSVGDPYIWSQQFMCEPQDENETFIPFSLLEYASGAELLPFSQLRECRELYGGLDIARKKNFSLLWLNEKVTSTLSVTRYILALQGEAFTRQNEKIGEVLAELPNLRRLCTDATGMGIGLTDFLQERFGTARVEGVTFTAATKEVMAFRLKKQLEDHSFLIPADRVIYDDFQLIKQDVTTSGNIRLSAGTKNDSHADRFWAAALTLEAAAEGAYVPPAVHVAKSQNDLTRRLDNILSGWKKDY
ncbi:MAG: terminase family protein [Culturomica sp.]|jgi:phage FluMu gp28-like protein|nr:terminase family protein [Culturomica sp.]